MQAPLRDAKQAEIAVKSQIAKRVQRDYDPTEFADQLSKALAGRDREQAAAEASGEVILTGQHKYLRSGQSKLKKFKAINLLEEYAIRAVVEESEKFSLKTICRLCQGQDLEYVRDSSLLDLLESAPRTTFRHLQETLSEALRTNFLGHRDLTAKELIGQWKAQGQINDQPAINLLAHPYVKSRQLETLSNARIDIAQLSSTLERLVLYGGERDFLVGTALATGKYKAALNAGNFLLTGTTLEQSRILQESSQDTAMFKNYFTQKSGHLKLPEDSKAARKLTKHFMNDSKFRHALASGSPKLDGHLVICSRWRRFQCVNQSGECSWGAHPPRHGGILPQLKHAALTRKQKKEKTRADKAGGDKSGQSSDSTKDKCPFVFPGRLFFLRTFDRGM